MAEEVQYSQPLPNSGGKKGILILVIIFVVLLIVFGVTYMIIGRNETEKTNTNTSANTSANTKTNVKTNTNTTPTAIEKNDDGWPDVFYSYTGSIVSVDNDKIVINASAEKNYLKVDKQMDIIVDNETSFVKVTIPDRFEPEQSGKLFERTEISKDSLRVGDVVTVISYENVKGKTEFLAKKVEVMN